MYKLQKEDYQKLYPYLLPSEVKEEFGDRAPTERTISQVYSDNNPLTPNAFLAKYVFKKSLAIMDLDISSRQWTGYCLEKFKEIRSKRKQQLWNKINKIEAIQDEG